MFRFETKILERGELFREHVVARPGATPCIGSLPMLSRTDSTDLYASAASGGEHRISATVEMLQRQRDEAKKIAEQYYDIDDMPGLE